MIGVIIAKRDRFLRECLKEVILQHGYSILHTCGTGNELIKAAIRHKPDLILCEYTFSDMHVTDAIRQIKKADSSARYIVYSYSQALQPTVSLLGDVSGFIHASCSVSDLIDCIKKLFLGQEATDLRMPAHAASLEKLSFREREILRKIAEYKTASQIASELFISIVTVNNHKANIVRKMELKGRNALMQLATALYQPPYGHS